MCGWRIRVLHSLPRVSFKWTILKTKCWVRSLRSRQRNMNQLARKKGRTAECKDALYLRTCWAKRKLVFGIVAAGILFSVLYALSLPNVYTSTTSLMPPDGTSPYANILGMLSPGSSASDVATEALGLETPGDLFISILGSRNVLDGVINRLDLTHYYQTRSMEDARRSLEGDTEIS